VVVVVVVMNSLEVHSFFLSNIAEALETGSICSAFVVSGFSQGVSC